MPSLKKSASGKLLVKNNKLNSGFVSYPSNNHTKLLLHGFGRDGSTQILDSSLNPKSISVNGGAKLSLDAPKFSGKTSILFNGSSDYLVLEDSEDWNLSYCDFTIEFWINLRSNSSTLDAVISSYTNTNTFFTLQHRASGGYAGWFFYWYNEAVQLQVGAVQGSNTTQLNTWYHIALVRSGSSFKIYQDGVLVASGTNANPIVNTTGSFIVGSQFSEPSSYYLNDLRITKNFARYTMAFKPGSSPFPNYEYGLDANTKLIVYGFGTNGSTNIYDSSSIPNAVTVDGNTQISTAQTVYEGRSSIYFAGNTDSVTVAPSSDWDFGYKDFSVECWIKQTSHNAWDWIMSFGQGNANADNSMYICFWDDNTIGGACFNSSGTQYNIRNSKVITDTDWHHVALCRNGDFISLAIDGVFGASVAVSGAMRFFGATNYLTLASARSYASGHFTGYMSGVIVSNGNARYSVNFIPSTVPYGGLVSPVDDYTKLLVHGFGSNDSTNIIDTSLSAKAISVIGNAKISTVQSKFPGKGSIYFDGSGDYLSLPDSPDWDFTGDFTVELMVMFVASPGGRGLIGHGGDKNSGGDPGWLLFITMGGKFYFGLYDNSSTGVAYIDSGIVATTNIWYHVALVRNGNTITLYVDGMARSTCEYGGVIDFGSANLLIGCRADQSNVFNGYISEIRVSKGIARWISNFTPSGNPYSDYGTNIDDYTKLLIYGFGANGSTNFIDNSPIPKAITANGNAVVSSNKTYYPGKTSLYFDGSGDYLTTPFIDDYNFTNKDFTVEVWIYLVSTQRQYIFGPGTDTSSHYGIGLDYNSVSSGKLGLYVSSTGSTWDLINADPGGNGIGLTTVSQNSWHHVSLVRCGNIWRVYLDGVVDIAVNVSGSIVSKSNTLLNIGRCAYTGGIFYFYGYMSGFRISNGIARYPNFRALPITLTEPQGSIDTDTRFLVHGFGVNESTIIQDSSFYPHLFSNSGVVVSTTKTRFDGKQSLSFNGSSYILFNAPETRGLNGKDFCYDFWLYLNRNDTRQGLISSHIGDTNDEMDIEIYTSKLFAHFRKPDNDGWLILSDTVITADVWHHIAIVRENGWLKIYLDGVLDKVSTTQYTGNIRSNTTNLLLGKYENFYLDGYMSEIRYSVGTPRYSCNFVPSGLPFSDFVNGVDENTSLMIHGSGPDGSTLIQDYSPNKKTLTVTNCSISKSQTKFGYGSIYFDGSSQIAIQDSTEWDFEGVFTIDANVYRTGNYIYIFGANPASSQPAVTKPSYYFYGAASEFGFGYTTGYGQWPLSIFYNGGISANEWHHVAIVRDTSNNIFLFLDGQVVATSTYVGTITNAFAGVFVGGCTNGSTINSTGYMSEIRVSKGIARWTANFNPGTTWYRNSNKEALEYNTRLLMSGFGLDQSNKILDMSYLGNQIVASGNAKVVSAQSVFDKGSVSFDGDGDFLFIPDVGDRWNPGIQDFSIQFWVKYGGSNACHCIGHVTGWITDGWDIYLGDSSVNGYIYNNGSSVSCTKSASMNDGKWHHIAYTKQGSKIGIAVDGSFGSWETALDFRSYVSTPGGVIIGKRPDGNASDYFNGYINDFRMEVGNGFYTDAFPVPFKPQCHNGNGIDENTVLALHFDGVNNQTTTVDSSCYGHPVSFVGNAKLSSLQKKFGFTSLLLDGSGDYITTPFTEDLDFGSGNFTVEFWVYLNSTTRQYFFGPGTDSASHYGLGLDYNSVTTQKLGLWVSSNGSTWDIINADGGGNGIGASIPTQNVWHHIAVVRNGNSWVVYLDGVADISVTVVGNIFARSGSLFNIGRCAYSSPFYANYYIDEFYVSKGIARYVSAFTLPSYPYSKFREWTLNSY
jgi:hypothetical protein